MFSFFTILRIIFNLIFAFGNLHLSNFISHIEKQKDSECSQGWKISTGKPLTSLLFLIGLANIFFPINNFISQIPFIGSTYALIFLLFLFITLFIVTRISKCAIEDTECDIQKFKKLCKMLSKINTSECIYIAIIMSIIFFYL